MTLAPSIQITIALLFVASLMTAMWLIQRRTGNAGIVDIAWTAAIGVLGLFFAFTSDGYALRRLIVGLLIGLWSLRLVAYLARRVLGHPEEGRYATLRSQWGPDANRRLFWFFQMQAMAAFLFALPVLMVAHNAAARLTVLDAVGVAIWLVGMIGVSLADRQLETFKSNAANQGKTCREGLWRFSRHPNYFFEWLLWWSYVPLAISTPLGWTAVVVPLALLYFILFVTGIPPTEAQAVASRGEDYRRYQRSTSAFVPWFPRKEAS